MDKKLNKFLKLFIILATFIATTSCKNSGINNLNSIEANNSKSDALQTHLWQVMCNNFKLQVPLNHNLVKHYINKYSYAAYHFDTVSKRAEPYLYYIVSELEKANLPTELALLPMIESGYHPNAMSTVGASGIWQIGAVTGKRYGLAQDPWYDGRRDIRSSTTAAINYLKFLHKTFNNDWYLALAAYNAGEGRVLRAIKENKLRKLDTSFWSLNLPNQTKHFVPKLLAIQYIIKNAKKYNLKLAHIHNKPHFECIDTGKQIDLKVAARLSELSLKEIRTLNPGYMQHTTHPNGPQHILLPTKNAVIFKKNLELELLKNNPLINSQYHIISDGDSLSSIAKHYKTTVVAIKILNNLNNDLIFIGKTLIIPV